MSKQKYKRNSRIIELFKSGFNYKRLAKRFKLSYSRICLLVIKFIKREDRKEILHNISDKRVIKK